MTERMSNEEYQQKFKDRWQGQQECLSIYTLSKDRGQFKCLKCGNIRTAPFAGALASNKCMICGRVRTGDKLKQTNEDIDRDLLEMQGGLFKRVTDYKSYTQEFDVECMNCHTILHKTIYSFRNLVYCPECSMNKSHGELFLQRLFDFNNVEYVKEKAFNNGLTQSQQRMDYYITSLKLCIEYQGTYHHDREHFQYRGDNWQSDIDKKDYLQSVGIDVLYVDGDNENIIKQLKNWSQYFDNLKIPDIKYIKQHHAPMNNVINDLKKGLTFQEIQDKYQIGDKLIKRYIKLSGNNTYDDLLFNNCLDKMGLNNTDDLIQWLRFHSIKEAKLNGLHPKPITRRIFKPYGFKGLTDLRHKLLTQEELDNYRKDNSKRKTARYFKIDEAYLREYYTF